MALVDDNKRGQFTAKKEIISLAGGMVFSQTAGILLDHFKAKGDMRTCFFLFIAVIAVLSVLHLVIMLMTVEPVIRTFEAIKQEIKEKTGNEQRPRVVYLTPWGHTFTQTMAQEFAKEENLVFLCGHYEGIDERALEEVATDFVSIGDYVLTGGELPAMVMIDAISRLIPGVLNNKDSAEYESFAGNLLEHPQYTRPEEYQGKKVPEVLLSGHHVKIEAWKKEQSLLRTKKYRPDLLD